MKRKHADAADKPPGQDKAAEIPSTGKKRQKHADAASKPDKSAKKAAKAAAKAETAATPTEAKSKTVRFADTPQPAAAAGASAKVAAAKAGKKKPPTRRDQAAVAAACYAVLCNSAKRRLKRNSKSYGKYQSDWSEQKNTAGVDIKVEVLHDYYQLHLKEQRLRKLGLLERKRKRMTQEQLQKEAEVKAVCPPFLVNLSAPGLTEAQERHLSFEAFGDEADVNGKPAYVISNQPGTNLIGGTFAAPDQSAEDNSHYVVGIYNRKTQTLKLAEAAGPVSQGGTIVRLEAQTLHQKDVDIAGLLKPEQQQRKVQLPKDAAAKRADARKLIDAFGSTRRKRQMKQREEGQVVVERNADEARLEMLMREVAARAEAANETRQEVMGKVGAARVIPAHDPKATLPHLAYKQSAMFPDSLLASLNLGQLLHAAEKKEDRDKLTNKQAVPAYVISRLQRITDETDQRKRKQRARTLALLAALLQLATARSKLDIKPPRPAAEPGGRDRPGGLEELAWSLRIGRKDVLQPLLEKFYNRTSEGGKTVYVREDYKQQLLLMHVLVTALDAEGWVLGPQLFDALRRELKMTAADVVSRFRELGCTCTAAKLTTAEGYVPSYHVALLPTGQKTLEESFPKPKTGAKQKAGR